MMKKTLTFIPFVFMPISYIYVVCSGLSDAGVLLYFAVALSWLPIAICLLYFLAERMKKIILAESGMLLHMIFSCFAFSTYYFSFICFVQRMGFVNKSIGYRVHSILLLFCIIFVFFQYFACMKALKARTHPNHNT